MFGDGRLNAESRISGNGGLVTCPVSRRRLFGGLLVRRERWGLSASGKLLVLLAIALGSLLATWKLNAFLSPIRPVAAQVLVVEGWIPDYALDAAVSEFRRGGYRLLLTSGNVTKDGWAETPHYTTAEWAAQRLKRRGLSAEVVAVPCRVERVDRTYHAALEVRRWLDGAGITNGGINVLTLGPHARRSWLLFRKALASGFRVGVISIAGREYDPTHWWRSSDGVREVVGEALAYLYARCLFFPSARESLDNGQGVNGQGLPGGAPGGLGAPTTSRASEAPGASLVGQDHPVAQNASGSPVSQPAFKP